MSARSAWAGETALRWWGPSAQGPSAKVSICSDAHCPSATVRGPAGAWPGSEPVPPKAKS